jgi:hypothetical protein
VTYHGRAVRGQANVKFKTITPMFEGFIKGGGGILRNLQSCARTTMT